MKLLHAAVNQQNWMLNDIGHISDSLEGEVVRWNVRQRTVFGTSEGSNKILLAEGEENQNCNIYDIYEVMI